MAHLKKLNKQVYAEFLIIFRETKRRSEMPRNGTLSQPLIFCSIRSVRFMGMELVPYLNTIPSVNLCLFSAF